jgi:hypothetical protein
VGGAGPTVSLSSLCVPGNGFVDFFRRQQDAATHDLAVVLSDALSLAYLVCDKLPDFWRQVFAKAPLLELVFQLVWPVNWKVSAPFSACEMSLDKTEART